MVMRKSFFRFALLVSLPACTNVMGHLPFFFSDSEVVRCRAQYEEMQRAHKKEAYKEILKRFVAKREVKDVLKKIEAGSQDASGNLLNMITSDKDLQYAYLQEVRETLGLKKEENAPVCDPVAEVIVLSCGAKAMTKPEELEQKKAFYSAKKTAGELLFQLAFAELIIEMHKQEGGLEKIAAESVHFVEKFNPFIKAELLIEKSKQEDEAVLLAEKNNNLEQLLLEAEKQETPVALVTATISDLTKEAKGN